MFALNCLLFCWPLFLEFFWARTQLVMAGSLITGTDCVYQDTQILDSPRNVIIAERNLRKLLYASIRDAFARLLLGNASVVLPGADFR